MATRPGLEPGTPWSVIRDANQWASPPPRVGVKQLKMTVIQDSSAGLHLPDFISHIGQVFSEYLCVSVRGQCILPDLNIHISRMEQISSQMIFI